MLQRLSIRRKLMVISMANSALALLLACAAFAAYDWVSFRHALAEDVISDAETLGRNCTAALTFGNEKDAASTLESMRSESGAIFAALYDQDGRLFASYLRPGARQTPPPAAPPQTGARFRAGCVEGIRPVVLDGRRIGTLMLCSDLEPLKKRLGSHAMIVAGVLVGSLLLAYGVLRQLTRFVSEPLAHLAATARTISTEKNYSVRALKQSDDELGELVDGFNEMLGQIEHRDAELKMHRDHLEDQVRARTAELQALNRQLISEKDRAEEASRAKSSFLANMSHEIRTPMTAILGYADMILEPDQTMSDRQDHLQAIRRNARHLMDLINDTLDLSKIEAGKMTVERIACDLPQLVTEVISLLRPRAIEKGLKFGVEFGSPLPRRILTDPLRLRQMLVNIIGNAIKFTQQGGIKIRVSSEASGVGGIVRFAVQDSGIGIDAQRLECLFQPFTQADDSMTRRFGGTGLGLCISKRLARLLGGDVTVASRPGHGSTFTISVEAGNIAGVEMVHELTESMFQDPAEGAAIAQARIELRGRILLAEDGVDNQLLISTHLRKAGADVVIAENGRMAVELACGGEYDLILMDMQMPELDGYSATSILRQRGYQRPIIALTAHAMVGDREKCLRAGCTDYLTKPIDKLRLLHTVDHYLRQSGVGQPPADPQQEPSRSIRSSSQDDPDLREILGQFTAGLPRRVQRLHELMREKDLAELQRMVHQLKGACGGYGFRQLSDLAARAEQKIKAQDAFDAITSEVNELIAMIQRVEGYATAEPGPF